MASIASVVVPAHNEAGVIERCLRSLEGANAHVVVVANGCRDDTAARARAMGATVVELDQSSKIAALNAGDTAAGDRYPRIYLDADIVLSGQHARDVIDWLAGIDAATVCAPQIVFDTAGSSWLVRTFYRAYRSLPYITNQLVGCGVYAVNEAGRERWGSFPEIINDDLFVQGRFSAAERSVVPGTTFTVTTPRTVANLLRVRTRIYLGNQQAAQQGVAGSMDGSRARSLSAIRGELRRRPAQAVAMAVYLAINALAAARARRRRTTDSWLTDRSTREPAR